MTSVFANNGILCQPQILKTRNSKLETRNCRKLPISEKTINTIREGMKKACEPGGTGWPLFEFKVKDRSIISQNLSENSQITSLPQSGSTEKLISQQASTNYRLISTGCKTGTAESQSKDSEPHAWFTVFAPFDKPEIILTVFVEEGGQGSDIAGPIAKEILKTYFERTE